jgi:hypothetical protein
MREFFLQKVLSNKGLLRGNKNLDCLHGTREKTGYLCFTNIKAQSVSFTLTTHHVLIVPFRSCICIGYNLHFIRKMVDSFYGKMERDNEGFVVWSITYY